MQTITIIFTRMLCYYNRQYCTAAPYHAILRCHSSCTSPGSSPLLFVACRVPTFHSPHGYLLLLCLMWSTCMSSLALYFRPFTVNAQTIPVLPFPFFTLFLLAYPLFLLLYHFIFCLSLIILNDMLANFIIAV
jgi:hypothetical protein